MPSRTANPVSASKSARAVVEGNAKASTGLEDREEVIAGTQGAQSSNSTAENSEKPKKKKSKSGKKQKKDRSEGK